MSGGSIGTPDETGTAEPQGLLSQLLVPHTQAGRLLALVACIDSLGTGMYLTSAALYFTWFAGLSAVQVGVGLTIGGLIGLAGAVPIGVLADRVGAGRVLVGLQVVRGLGFLAYCFVDEFWWYVAVSVLIGLVDAVISPITTAVVGAAVPNRYRIDTMAKSRAARNVGFGLGAVLATAVIHGGAQAGFLALIVANAVSCLLTAVLLVRIGIVDMAPQVRKRRIGRERLVLPDWRYLLASVLNGILSLHITLLTIGLPLWLTQHTSAPVALVGVSVVVNTVLVVLLQARMARPATTLAGGVRCMRRAGLALAVFCLGSIAMAGTASPLLASALALVAVTALTFGELWQSAGEWKISYDLADPQRRSQYVSTFQLGLAAQRVGGPAVVTGLILPSSWSWAALAVIVAAAGVLFRPLTITHV